MCAASNLEILDYCDTPLGVLCLRRRELLAEPGTVVTEVTINHEFLMSSYNTDSEVALARLAMGWHGGKELDVLVGGLGLGYTAHAALENKAVTNVEVLELLPEVISWFTRDLVPLASSLTADPRFRAVEGDIFERLAQAPRKTYDAILIDVDHNPEELLDQKNAAFYTPKGLSAARAHLNAGGVLAIWSSAENDAFARTLDKVFSEIKIEAVHWRNELLEDEEEQRDDLFMARD